MPLLMDDQCNCDIPFLWETYSPFLGRATRIRLCCIARYLEEYFETSFHQTWDAEPQLKWPDAEKDMPDWIVRRIEEKKAAGFSMEEFPDQDELAEELKNMGKDNLLETHIKFDQPVERGSKHSWERDEFERV